MCPSTASIHALHFGSSQQAWRHIAANDEHQHVKDQFSLWTGWHKRRLLSHRGRRIGSRALASGCRAAYPASAASTAKMGCTAADRMASEPISRMIGCTLRCVAASLNSGDFEFRGLRWRSSAAAASDHCSRCSTRPLASGPVAEGPWACPSAVPKQQSRPCAAAVTQDRAAPFGASSTAPSGYSP